MHSKSIVTYICPQCRSRIRYQADMRAREGNLSGVWKVHCLKCNTVHIHRIGKDIYNSTILEGGRVIDMVLD